MKKIILLLLAILTFYIAGMYQSLPLMLLFLAELLICLLLYCCVRYFRRRLVLRLDRTITAVTKAEPFALGLTAENHGRLPIHRFSARLSLQYLQLPQRERETLVGGIAARDRQTLTLRLKAARCGMVDIFLDRVRVYDYLTLFTARQKTEDTIKLALFPTEKLLRFEPHAAHWQKQSQFAETALSRPGDDHSEIRQLREYRPGDSGRYIHWNQSARTGELLIKEYETEAYLPVHLLLAPDWTTLPDAEVLDAFYEILAAVVLGLLKQFSAVSVHWYDPQLGGYTRQEVRTSRQLREILLQLYQKDFSAAPPTTEHYYRDLTIKYPGALKLDAGLQLSGETGPLFQFSAEHWAAEIRDTVVII